MVHTPTTNANEEAQQDAVKAAAKRSSQWRHHSRPNAPARRVIVESSNSMKTMEKKEKLIPKGMYLPNTAAQVFNENHL